MYKNKVLLLVLSAFLSLQFVASQNNINSPYTRFGYGDISEATPGENRAMGGVALGSRSKGSINTVNPASYSTVDSMSFKFDIGTSVLSSRFSDLNKSAKTFNANLEYITMMFPLGKGFGFSAGLLPYSFAGYNMYGTDSIIGAGNEVNYLAKGYKGDGGFSQVYTGLSYKFLKHFSLGLNAYYLYGSVNNEKSLRIFGLSDSTREINSIKANNFRLRYGFQYFNTFNKKHDVTLGLVYEQKTKLSGNNSIIKEGVIADTTNIVGAYELPVMFGIGVNYCYNQKLTVALDYTLQKWGDAKFSGNVGELKDKSKVALGLEYVPNQFGRKFSDRIHYRAGSNYSNAYYNVPGTIQPKNYGLTFGLGLPLYNKFTNTVSMFNASFEYGKIGSRTNLREDYFKFTLNVVFNEHWFFKRKL